MLRVWQAGATSDLDLGTWGVTMAIKTDLVTGESLGLRLYNSRVVAMTVTIILRGVQWLKRKG